MDSDTSDGSWKTGHHLNYRQRKSRRNDVLCLHIFFFNSAAVAKLFIFCSIKCIFLFIRLCTFDQTQLQVLILLSSISPPDGTIEVRFIDCIVIAILLPVSQRCQNVQNGQDAHYPTEISFPATCARILFFLYLCIHRNFPVISVENIIDILNRPWYRHRLRHLGCFRCSKDPKVIL